MAINRRIVLASRPQGRPSAADFRLEEAPVPEPGPDQVLCRTIYLSLDPYMRGRMSDAASYAQPVQIGQVMEGGSVGQVVRSNLAGFAPGDFVVGHGGWQEYALFGADGVRKVDPKLAPISTALGALGMPAQTAYVGLREIGKPKHGETLVVAAAAGPVGSMVGQIAKIRGCRVVGIAGSEGEVRVREGRARLRCLSRSPRTEIRGCATRRVPRRHRHLLGERRRPRVRGGAAAAQ